MLKIFQTISNYFDLIRWDKPIGSLLLLWPTLTGLWVASDGYPRASILIIFLAGTFLMRAAGCAINDFWDRDFDQHVGRTQSRQIVTGKITAKGALFFSGSLALFAFFLVSFLNRFTIILAIMAGILACIYPLMKRVTHFPQAILGLAYSMGILMTFAAVHNHLPASAWVLFFISFLWTIMYDTEYAMMDREEDLKIGVKSIAIFFGKRDIQAIAFMQTLIILGLFSYGYFLNFNYWYFLGILGTALLFGLQILLLKTREVKNYQKAFLNNNWAWFLVFLGVFLHFLGP